MATENRIEKAGMHPEQQPDMAYFWHKRTVVSFLLSVLVMLAHSSVFDHYPMDETFWGGINRMSSVLFHYSFACVVNILFFVLSGAVFFSRYRRGQYLEKLRSRVKTLAIPYLIWNTVNMMFYIVTSYTFISNYFIGRQKFVISLPNVLESIFLYKCNGPFWFLFNLMLFVLCTPLIHVLLSRKGLAYGTVLVMLATELICGDIPEQYVVLWVSFLSYFVGGIIGTYQFQEFARRSNGKEQVICGAIALAVVCILQGSGCGYFTLPVIVFRLLTLLFALCFWRAIDGFAGRLPKWRFLQDSFLIFAMHVNTSAVITKLIYLALPKDTSFMPVNFVGTTVLSIVCICVFSALLERYFPKVYAVVTGAR